MIDYPGLAVTSPGLLVTQQTLTDSRGRFKLENVLPRGIRILGKEYFLKPGQHLVVAAHERSIDDSLSF